MRKVARPLALLLACAMLFSFLPAAMAAEQAYFPLLTKTGELVADENTMFITLFEQDPDNKLITATVQVHNGSTTEGTNLTLSGVGMEISFSGKVAPYAYDPAIPVLYNDAFRVYTGSGIDSVNDPDGVQFKKYCDTPLDGFDTLGTFILQNDNNGKIVSARISTATADKKLSIGPGETVEILKVYFVPVNGEDELDIDMFNYIWTTVGPRRYTTWIGDGTYFLVSNDKFTTSINDVYVLSPKSFKLHLRRQEPTGLFADDSSRTIKGYDDTMEWLDPTDGEYKSGAPVIGKEDQTVYVRTKGDDDYSGSDEEYGDYKKWIPSEPVPVVFGAGFFSAGPYVSLTKTSENKSSTDGRTHVGDIIEYTVTAKNDGDPRSAWADAVMTDVLPDYVTYVGIDAAWVTAATYDDSTRTLTVNLGDIPGQTEKKVTFFVKVDDDAYEQTIKNSVKVEGTDGKDGEDLDRTAEDGGGHEVVGQTDKPKINLITEGDETITGEGIPGAEIVVTFPDGSTEKTEVDEHGNWEVDAPPTLMDGDEVSAVQTAGDLDPSEKATEIVGGRPEAELSIEKKSEDISSEDGKIHVNDIIEYTVTVKNTGDSKSIVLSPVVTDNLPDGVTFTPDSVTIDGTPAVEGTEYTYVSGILTVNLEDIYGGTETVIVFRATVDADAYGKDIKNTVSVKGEDAGTGEILEGGADDEGGDVGSKTVVEQSEKPTIDPVTEDSDTITGTGVPEAEIVVTFPNGETETAIVDEDGNWSVDVPDDVELEAGDVITAIQTEEGKDPSEEAEVTVGRGDGPYPYAAKSSENLTRDDGKTYIGDVLKYTITVGNNGNADWENVIITDELPEGLTFLGKIWIDGEPATPNQYSFVMESRILTVRLGNIAAGDEVIVTFEAIVDADAEGLTIRNAATISSDNNEDKYIEEPGDGREVEKPSESGPFAVKTSKNKSSEDEKTYVGNTIEYIITAGYNGDPDSYWENPVITDVLPDGVTFVEGSVTVDGVEKDYTYDETSRTLVVELDDIAGGEMVIVRFEVTVNPDAWNMTIKNGAVVSSDNEEDVVIEEPGDGREVVDDRTGPDPYATKSSENLTRNSGRTSIGDTLLYTIVVGNGGGSVWKDVVITDVLPDGLTFVADSVKINGAEAQYAFDPDSRVLTVELGNIAADAEKTVTFEAVVAADAVIGSEIKNSATITGEDKDGGEVKIPVEEEGGRTVEDISDPPVINPVNEGDDTVTGTGVPGAEIIVTFPGGETAKDTVDEDGNWSVEVPDGVELKEDDKITAIQTEEGKDPSDEAEVTVGKREDPKVSVTVTFDATTNNGSLQNSADATKIVYVGDTYGTLPAVNSRNGYTFIGWYPTATGGTRVWPNTEVKTAQDHILYAQWSRDRDDSGDPGTPGDGGTIIITDPEIPLLNMDDHFAYIVGYPDKTVRPDNSITRAEVAMIFYKLITDSNKSASRTSAFSDVPSGAWYAQAVNYLASVGILSGYTDGTFRPNSPITRAEFAAIASKFDKLESTSTNAFTDVSDSHWARSYINSAYAKGWVSGYSDGTFKPQANITRAEVVSIVNTMLERKIMAEDIPSGIINFTDLSVNHWAYTDIVEASNEHDYEKDADGFETWTLK